MPIAKSWCSICFLLLFASVAFAFDEPTGVNKAQFGMTPAELLKEYPKAQLIAKPTPKPGSPVNLESYTLEGQKVGPLSNCRLEFRFFGGRLELYEVQGLCPDKDEVSRYLTKTFGMPTRTTSSTLTWIGSKTTINYVPKGGAFSYADNERARGMQSMLLNALRSMKLGGAPTPTP